MSDEIEKVDCPEIAASRNPSNPCRAALKIPLNPDCKEPTKEQPMSDTLQERESETTTTDYCDECKGRPHAPWCSEFEPPETEANQLLPDGISSVSAGSEHQPAARGGSDDEWIDKLLDTVAYAQDVDKRVAARLQIKHAVNQHHSLVAEREQLIVAAKATVERLSDLPRFLEKNCTLSLGRMVAECLADLAVAIPAEQRSTSE